MLSNIILLTVIVSNIFFKSLITLLSSSGYLLEYHFTEGTPQKKIVSNDLFLASIKLLR